MFHKGVSLSQPLKSRLAKKGVQIETVMGGGVLGMFCPRSFNSAGGT